MQAEAHRGGSGDSRGIPAIGHNRPKGVLPAAPGYKRVLPARRVLRRAAHVGYSPGYSAIRGESISEFLHPRKTRIRNRSCVHSREPLASFLVAAAHAGIVRMRGWRFFGVDARWYLRQGLCIGARHYNECRILACLKQIDTLLLYFLWSQPICATHNE